MFFNYTCVYISICDKFILLAFAFLRVDGGCQVVNEETSQTTKIQGHPIFSAANLLNPKIEHSLGSNNHSKVISKHNYNGKTRFN
ncbi:hypothetical protein CDL12_13408 [Handroanthus impetiginosus]|uniref:Secreted protein n=1 Tax=Handroanthus impetiginosus TaxID=429701 RepID=A0A2G9H8W2_9LAMI|nr:hypothetical protein CDL12_13408 [Handroanthus impetiginosus]